MNDDFIEVLSVQLRQAATRQERRSRRARAVAAARATVPRVSPGAAVAALVVGAILAASIYAVMILRPEPAAPPTPTIVDRFAPGGALGEVGGFGSAWLDDTDHQQLLRMDPRNHEVTARIAVRGDAALATGDDAVWVIESPSSGFSLAGPLLRVDPRTNRVVARIPLRTTSGQPFAASDVHPGRGVVWIVGPDGALRIDPRTNTVTKAIIIGSTYEASRGALSGNDLWLNLADGRLLRYDARTGVRTGVRQGPESGTVATVAGGLYNLADSAVTRLDPATGGVLWRSALHPANLESPDTVTSSDGLLWLPTKATGRPGVRIVGLDPNTGRVVSRTPQIAEFGVTGLSRVGRELWMTTAGGRVVVTRP
jgi:outer membrane protein assembly factor BamB